jgi:tRNA(Phe) wybutosine-synthesizing methylase Tyw3
MDVPVAEDGKLLVDEKYIRWIVGIANEKFSKGRAKLEKMEKDVREKIRNTN